MFHHHPILQMPSASSAPSKGNRGAPVRRVAAQIAVSALHALGALHAIGACHALGALAALVLVAVGTVSMLQALHWHSSHGVELFLMALGRWLIPKSVQICALYIYIYIIPKINNNNIYI